MAEEYNRGVGAANWWDSSATSSSSIVVDSTATVSSSCSSVVFPQDPAALQIMGLGLSSDHWSHQQPLIRRNDKAGEMGGGFRSMLQEGMIYGSNTQKHFTGADDPSPEFKPVKGFSLDQFSHGSSVDSCSQGLASPTFINPLDSSSPSVYGSPNSGILQGIMGSGDQHQHQQPGYGYQSGYGVPPSNQDGMVGSANWPPNPNKVDQVPQFLKNSMVDPNNHGSTFWNMPAPAADPRPASFFPVASPMLQAHQMPMSSFDEKPRHNMMEVRETGRKSGGSDQNTTTSTTTTTSAAAKRSRNEASSALPPFKVRKEKMGDRITALQQLVSPFGKTDTASVLSEAIEYIKFLHEQVNVLSTPYLKSGASNLQHQQSSDKSKDHDHGPKQDLRSRGLCLVPVSSTFPVAHETTVDFWTPTFGGTFR